MGGIMFTSKVWRVIACGAIGLGALVVVLSIGQPRAQADSTAPGGNGGATPIDLSVGSGHACVTMSNGRLLCWGSQGAASPVLGDGTGTTRLMPVDVSNIASDATNVAAGGTLSCAIV